MKRNNIIFISIVILAVVGILIYRYWNDNYTNEAIYRNVITQKGYTLREIEKPIKFSSEININWIPNEVNKEKKLNVEISRVKNIPIILESIIRRENDIYFNFTSNPNFKYTHGFFLSNEIINEDGTAATFTLSDSFSIKSGDMTIQVGQTGFGPGPKFSFGIENEDLNQIKDDFRLDFIGSILYEYSKK